MIKKNLIIVKKKLIKKIMIKRYNNKKGIIIKKI